MTIRPRSGVSGTALLEHLRELARQVDNINGLGGSGYERLDRLATWLPQAATQLASVTTNDAVKRLIVGRLRSVQSIVPSDRSAGALSQRVNWELSATLRDLREAVEALEARLAYWEGRPGAIVFIDTNAMLHHKQYFNEIDWAAVVPGLPEQVQLVVPMVVVDELDLRKRSARGEKIGHADGAELTRKRAKNTLKRLDEMLHDPRGWVALSPGDLAAEPQRAGVRLSVLHDEPGHVRLPRNDDEIVDQAAGTRDLTGRPVHVTSFDTGLKFRVRSVDLLALGLEGGEAE